MCIRDRDNAYAPNDRGALMKISLAAILAFCIAAPAIAQDQPPKCFFLCEPKVKVEPSFTWENWVKAPRIAETDDQGNTTIKKVEAENVFETVIAVDIPTTCLLYTSDAADERSSVDLGGRRIIK